MNIILKGTFVVAAMSAGVLNTAYAAKAGTIMFEGGLMTIVPQNSSGDLTAPSFVGTQAKVESAYGVAGSVGYMLTDNVSVLVPVVPQAFKHDLVGDGAIAGVGKIGSVKILPATVFLQYRFSNPDTTPYIGLGATYAYIYSTKGTAALSALTGGAPTTFSVDSKLAATPQVGMTVKINDAWFLDFMYAKTFLTTKARMSTGQMLKTKLDPDTFSLQVGYKF